MRNKMKMANGSYMTMNDYKSPKETKETKEVGSQTDTKLDALNYFVLCKILYSLFLYVFLGLASKCLEALCYLEPCVKTKHEKNRDFLNKIINNIDSEAPRVVNSLKLSGADALIKDYTMKHTKIII